MAALSAFIIPIGTLVAGEGLAALVLEHQTMSDLREERWREAEFTVIYPAVFVCYMQQGIADKDAKQRALAEVKGYLTTSGHSPAVHLLSATSRQSERTTQNNSNGVRAKIKANLIEHPEIVEMFVNRTFEVARNCQQVSIDAFHTHAVHCHFDQYVTPARSCTCSLPCQLLLLDLTAHLTTSFRIQLGSFRLVSLGNLTLLTRPVFSTIVIY